MNDIIMTIEINLANFSFLCLFASLIFFWAGTSFKTFLNLKKIAKVFVVISNFLISFWLILRWKESGHFPLSNLYESLMFLSWCFTLSNLLLENPLSFIGNNTKVSVKENLTLGAEQGLDTQGNNPIYNSTNKRTKRNVELLSFDSFSIVGAVSIPSALFTNAFATFTLPTDMQQASSLVPALQSNWLMMHVTVMILSYAALIIGSLLSIAYLIELRRNSGSLGNLCSSSVTLHEGKEAREEFESVPVVNAPSPLDGYPSLVATQQPSPKAAVAEGGRRQGKASPKACVASVASTEGTQTQRSAVNTWRDSKEMALLSFLDNLSYRFLGFGFPLLTIGILSGAVWANEAWGSYWSWDPKETWAFLTWLVFAIYLHLRLSYGLEGEKPAYVASIGFVIVWICFLGVNFIGEGLHSYGWMVKS